MKLFAWLLDLIYPPKCTFCGKLLKKDETDICAKCRKTLPEVGGSIKRGENFRQCWSVYSYEDYVVDSIHRFKFGGMQHYAQVYGRLIAMLLLRSKVEFDVLTWVPISGKRRKKRGYEQAYLIAKTVAAELHCACVPTLKKVRDNPPQSLQKSAAKRRGNVLNAYRAVHPERFRGKRVLLIDDIITTGATLSECSKVLRMAGAVQVECATLAATQYNDKKDK
ncbi:MAG: ComF family protein [Oscillospiraceae bacterium]|nr:ComF family protein [Oscillospiraceae bacterium]